jgi:hypothetical protein
LLEAAISVVVAIVPVISGLYGRNIDPVVDYEAVQGGELEWKYDAKNKWDAMSCESAFESSS